jgi:mannosylglycoprotein endo-beta-mannosidase
MNFCKLLILILLCALPCPAQQAPTTVEGWQMQDVAKVIEPPAVVASDAYRPKAWYRATVPGTVLATLVDNGVYPDPLYGENMRAIPESLNKTSYWYRTILAIPRSNRGQHTWLHFGGINYSAQVWLNGHQIGAMRGAFIRGDFDITPFVKPGGRAALAVLVSPEPHPGIPHEHTVAGGLGRNGGETAIDGPTFLSTIGWDWLPAIRDRDTGIWLPVTLSATGPVVIRNPYITSTLSPGFDAADLHLTTVLSNLTQKPVAGKLIATISGHGPDIVVQQNVTAAPGESTLTFDPAKDSHLHLTDPQLWWPNGYGQPNLYHLSLQFLADKLSSDTQQLDFGIRQIKYEVPGSPSLTLVVNGVKVMVRGGDWGLDDGLKRIPRERLNAQFHMHALAHLNMIRNWVGQSTSPDFYEMADKYGLLLWDEFFQPNPSDGPNPADIQTYLANVTDKVLRFRNHPSIAIWCARNEGRPPKELDEKLAAEMALLDPGRLYQSSSTEGRGVSSHGPYYWRAPRFFYQINEAFKTETGSVSVPTLESVQGMMPQKDWETIDDDWAQHDMAAGAQRGNEYPSVLARRFGPIRNLADFVRKAQLANYEAFRGMYESRNAQMFKETTGILTWMSHPAQPSFVWQLYHYDLEPNASLYAVQKAAESVHVQFNQSNRIVQVVNNRPVDLHNLTLTQSVYRLDGTLDHQDTAPVNTVTASSAQDIYTIEVNPGISEVYFLKFDLKDSTGTLLSTNFYWQNVAQDDYSLLETMPPVTLKVQAVPRPAGDKTFDVTVTNSTKLIALMTHLQLHDGKTGKRVLPVFYSDNYLSLVPGETRTLTIEAETKDVGSNPTLLVDGYNVKVEPVEQPVAVLLNQNAQPMQWPASNLVPETTGTR